MARAFHVLGPLQVVIDDVVVTPRAPKERGLLALLLVSRGRVVSADRIIDELWPALDVARARRVLWVRIAGLRRRLGTAGAAPLLQLVPPGYRLDVRESEVDVWQFHALVDRARAHRAAGDPSTAAADLRAALDLWTGDPLSDAQGCPALEAEAAGLADARLDAVEDWVEAELACGRHEALLTELSRLVAANPLRERLGRQRVVCLERAGRHAEAVAACRELRLRLEEELGVGESVELLALEHDLRARALAPAGPARLSPAGRAPPVPLTRFVGRAADLAEVAALLTTFRLVTLTGVGGVGKTRLALEVAAAAPAAAGVRWVELAPVPDDDAVVGAVAAALGILADGGDGTEDVAGMVAGHLADRPVLLVLDNAEHVAPGASNLLHRVLTAGTGCRALITSREALHLPGEVVYAVPPLSLPRDRGPGDDGRAGRQQGSDAVELFRERARRARPGTVLEEADEASIAKVCRRLDGLPLAIELAAARTRLLAVGQIAERLDDCFALLTGVAAPGVPARHRTMRAAIDWSHDLLAPGEQVALRRLAVFPAHFDLDAAMAVIEGTAVGPAGEQLDGLALLSRLVDKSLVEVVAGDGHVRYRLLEPIRQYGEERLAAAGEVQRARRCHRDHVLSRSGRLWPLMSAQERQALAEARDDLLAALAWSFEQGDAVAAAQLVVVLAVSWMCPGDAQGRAWLERVLATPEPAVHPARVRALVSLALILHDAGEDRPRAEELLSQAEDLAVRVGDAGELAACRLARVEVEMACGRTASARAHTQAALAAYEALGEAAGVGWCHHGLGWIAVAEGDDRRGLAHFERALALARSDAGGGWLLPHALAALAPLVAREGDARRSLRLADEAVEAARPFGVRAVLAMALARAAETAVVADDIDRAGRVVAELVGLLLDLATRRWAADALEVAAIVLARRGDDTGAATALGASQALRAAADGHGGAVRPVDAAVRTSSARSHIALGPDRFAAAVARGRSLVPEAALAEVLAALEASTPGDVRAEGT